VTPANAVRLRLAHDVYDAESLKEASEAYAQNISVSVLQAGADETEVMIEERICVAATVPGVVDEFLNYLLDTSIRKRYLASTTA